MTSFLTARHVGHTYATQQKILANISLAIKDGSFVSLVGASGVGKSTLLRILGGLISPTQGEVLLDNMPAHTRPRPIGIVFQKANLMAWRTVYDNIRLPLEIVGQTADADDKIAHMLSLVGLTEYASAYPAQLSGGMAQRVAIARALVHEPDFLLLDEPFGALDAITRERMGQELLHIWRALPVTVLMVTHAIEEAVFLADEVWVMNGRPAHVTHHISIDLPRPRTESLRIDAKFLALTQEIRQAIQTEIA